MIHPFDLQEPLEILGYELRPVVRDDARLLIGKPFQGTLNELQGQHADELAHREQVHATEMAELMRKHEAALHARTHNLTAIRQALGDKLAAQEQAHALAIGEYKWALKEAEREIAKLRAQLPRRRQILPRRDRPTPQAIRTIRNEHAEMFDAPEAALGHNDPDDR